MNSQVPFIVNKRKTERFKKFKQKRTKKRKFKIKILYVCSERLTDSKSNEGKNIHKGKDSRKNTLKLFHPKKEEEEESSNEA